MTHLPQSLAWMVFSHGRYLAHGKLKKSVAPQLAWLLLCHRANPMQLALFAPTLYLA